MINVNLTYESRVDRFLAFHLVAANKSVINADNNQGAVMSAI